MINASVVLYNTDRKELFTIIDCLEASCVETIYLVDNSPTDNLNGITKYANKIVCIRNDSNMGYGKAHNIAIRESIKQGAKYHLVLNPDIEFSKGTIEKLAEFMEENPDAGLVMPKVFYPDGRLQYLCRLIPSPFDVLFKRSLPNGYKSRRVNDFQLRFTKYNSIMNIPSLSGCCMFLKVDALKRVGLFDERFFMYAEDVDLTRRIHKEYKTLFYPYVEVKHVHGAASHKNLKMLFIHITNMIKYFNKWGWFLDKERKRVNSQTLKELNHI
jgi:GT2 family glycosyltransferase